MIPVRASSESVHLGLSFLETEAMLVVTSIGWNRMNFNPMLPMLIIFGCPIFAKNPTAKGLLIWGWYYLD